MINKIIRKNIIIVILIVVNFLLLILGGYLFLSNKDEEIIQEITKQRINITERSLQYNLLYSIDLENSLKPQCNWENISFNWTFPKLNEFKVYKTAITEIELENDNETEKEMYPTINDAIDAFYNQYPETKNLEYDYQVEIYSDEKSTYEKMPLFSSVNGLKIYASNLGIWRDTKEELIAGLYEVTNSFKQFNFTQNDFYFSFPAKSEEYIKKDILTTEIKFLNHEYLCENSNITNSQIDSIEIIYINWGEYILPVYKIIGLFKIENENIQWTALINPIDFTKLDYIIYTDKELQQTFIPKPFISDIEIINDKYNITGFLPNKLFSKQTESFETAESFNIQFIAKDKTGEYIYGERKTEIQKEINNSLEVSQDGEFEFNFSSENFWKVEKLIYEDENGNEIEPYHSADNEITRSSYDNWFKIKVCSNFKNDEYCGESSKLYYLEYN